MTDPATPSAWARMGPVKRTVVVVLVAVVGVNLGLSILGSLTGGAEPGGPRSSSFATGEDGVAAWSDLVARRGQEVTRLRRPLSAAPLDPTAAVVVADPEQIDTEDAEALARFVAAGGRLVAVGRQGAQVAGAIAGTDLSWDPTGAETAIPLAPVAETDGVAQVRGAGAGALGTPGPFLPVLGAPGRTVAALRAGPTPSGDGRGSVVVVADSTVFQNRFLAEADNAAFAVAVTAGRPVVFAEAVHGYGASRGLAALPSAWKWTAGALVVALLLGIWCFGQRFGPPEDTERRLPPARRDYVDALASGLAAAGPPAAATAGLRAEARRRLLARASLPRDATDREVRAAGEQSGLSSEEVEALLSGPGDAGPAAGRGSADDLMALGRAASRLAPDR